MGKRKHKDKEENISRRLKRIERFLRNSCSSDSSGDGSRHRREHRSRSKTRHRSLTSRHRDYSRSRSPVQERCSSRSSIVEDWHSEDEKQDERQKSQSSDKTQTEMIGATVTEQQDAGTEINIETLPQEILEALGDPKSKEEVFGPKIPDEISKRWGRVLLDGLTKDQKQEVSEKILIPENFQLVKAPLLNPEIVSVLSDPVKNRDKLLEKTQNHLGLGIAGLTNFTASLIEGEMSKIEIIKKISEINQIFLDLHHENTISRRKLVISSLDKKFVSMIADVKRDSYLFGVNLGEKIKASKTAEKSGLHIKRSDGATASTSKKYPQQGNWRGPLRNNQRTHRSSGPRRRYHNAPPPGRRPPQSTERQSGPAPKAMVKSRKP